MLEGSCLCGSVRFRIEGEVSPIEVCHCVQCRKWTGHQFANIEVARAGLGIEDESRVTWFRSSDKVRRGFCGRCGSPLFFDPLDHAKHAWIGVAMGALDTPTGGRIARHIFASEKGDYYAIPAGEPQEG